MYICWPQCKRNTQNKCLFLKYSFKHCMFAGVSLNPPAEMNKLPSPRRLKRVNTTYNALRARLRDTYIRSDNCQCEDNTGVCEIMLLSMISSMGVLKNEAMINYTSIVWFSVVTEVAMLSETGILYQHLVSCLTRAVF